jgi:hypothetical protein
MKMAIIEQRSCRRTTIEGQDTLEQRIVLLYCLVVYLCNLLVLLQLLLCPRKLFLSFFTPLLEIIKFTSAAVASAVSRSRSSLSFDDEDLVDATCLMPTLFRKLCELFWDSTWVTTWTLENVGSPSATGALKASIFD